MTTLLLVIGILLALALSALSSGCETGTYCVNRLRLRVRAEKGDSRAQRLGRLLERPEDLVITTLAGTNVADYLASAFVVALLLHHGHGGGASELYATAILTPLVLVVGGIIPKDWFRRESDRLMYSLSGLLEFGRRALATVGLLALLRGLAGALLKRFGPDEASAREEALPRARMRRLLIEGAASGGLSRLQRESIDRILRLTQSRVGALMIPLARAATVPEDISREELLRIARMAHFSRLPVYHGDRSNIIGVISVHDVLFDDDPRRPPREYIREILKSRADETAAAALLRLQQMRQVMACVVDRRGRSVGLFTVKDLVARVVGEIEGL